MNKRPELLPYFAQPSPAARAIVPGTALLTVVVLTLSALPEAIIGESRLLLVGASVPLVLLLLGLRHSNVSHRSWVVGPGVLAVVYSLITITGGPAQSSLYPLVFIWLTVVASLLSPRVAILTGLLAIGIEVSLYLLGDRLTLPQILAHGGFMALFAGLFATMLLVEVRSARKERDEAIKTALDRVEQDAQDFRLIGSSLGPESRGTRAPSETAQIRQVGSVRAIRESLLDVLEVARLAVNADATMVFMLNESGTKLKLKECICSEDERSIVEKPISASEGALGAVIKTERAVNLKPRQGGRGLGYKTRANVGSFLGVPVKSSGHICGVLAVDRVNDDDFTAHDEEILAAVAQEVERAMESERIFSAMDRAKYEQERFYEAFSLLNEALTVDVFADRLLEAVSRIRALDFLAVTLFDDQQDAHSIVSVRTTCKKSEASLKSQIFKNREGGLVAMALKNGHALPYRPLSMQPEKGKLQLFGKLDHPNLSSVKVFPLMHRDSPIGALVVGSSIAGGDLTREEERMIETVSTHAAITLANASMYKRMEMMATTDGLTGLVNHRRFKELLDEALARAIRFGRNVSVLMVDADHFKSINDTYGHSVGDIVLKRIAQLLQNQARRTDVVARYGGEEFVVILDETESEAAYPVAERIRQSIEQEVIQGDFGRVRVTASFGLCTWPDQASGMGELLERSDQALYEAKRKGRNRVVVWRSAHCAIPDDPAIGQDKAAESSPPQVQA